MNKNTWFTSDEHYFHKNICRFAGRPFESVEKMNRALIENHNSIVGPDDDVYHLGDFCFARIDQTESILRQLSGNHHFVRGNHDKELLKNIQRVLDKKLFLTWDKDAEIYVEGQFIVLHHYGKRVWNKYHHGAWHLFGHSHGNLPPYGKSVDVGVDSKWITGNAEYRPFSFKEIKRFMDKRSIEYADMHGKDHESVVME
jgi:calcineurin-like phosphoesterase family protein